MKRRAFLRLLTGAVVTTALGLGFAGCSHKSGRQVYGERAQSADLIVNNQSRNTLKVYIDGGEIGEAAPFGTARFQILSGFRTVEVRERGHSEFFDYGDIYFGFDPIEITYTD